MARYEHLPIFREAYDLTLHLVEKIVRDFSRYNKYTLGSDLKESMRKDNPFYIRDIRLYLNAMYNTLLVLLLMRNRKNEHLLYKRGDMQMIWKESLLIDFIK